MWCWDCNKILTTTFKEEGRNLKIFDYETNIIWFLYLYTFIGSVIKYGGAKKFKFYWRFRHSTCIKMFHIVDCVSSWLYKHTIYTNVDEIITLRTNQCKRRITFYRQELIFISNAQPSLVACGELSATETHFKNFILHGKIHKEMRTEVLNKTASAWLLKIVMILIPLQALECFWWASVCKFFGGGLLLQEFANACSSMAFKGLPRWSISSLVFKVMLRPLSSVLSSIFRDLQSNIFCLFGIYFKSLDILLSGMQRNQFIQFHFHDIETFKPSLFETHWPSIIKRQKTNWRTGKSCSQAATQFFRGIFTHFDIFTEELA